MAAGVIQSLSKFRLPMAFQVFQHPLLSTVPGQEMAFHYLSGEDNMEEEEGEEEEEEEEEEGEEEGGEEIESAGLPSPARKEEATKASTSLSNTEMTLQLLQFAERISDDIQRYFGRKSKMEEEEEEGTSSIDEDFCSPPLSGRVLCYTDLSRISQCRETKDEEDFPHPLKPFLQLWRSLCRKDEKLGPLAELFEYGLCRCLQHRLSPDSRKLARLERKYAHVTPMQGRKLPQSFWKEPTLSPLGMLSSNPPDFSDLLANWTSELGQEELSTSQENLGEVPNGGH